MLINPGHPFTRERNDENIKQQMYPYPHQAQAQGKEETPHTQVKELPVAREIPGSQAENALLSNTPLTMFPWKEQGQESTASSEISAQEQNIYSPCQCQSLLSHQGGTIAVKY